MCSLSRVLPRSKATRPRDLSSVSELGRESSHSLKAIASLHLLLHGRAFHTRALKHRALAVVSVCLHKCGLTRSVISETSASAAGSSVQVHGFFGFITSGHPGSR